MSPPTVDENGFVTGFSHHDGFLDGVVVDEHAKEAHLALRSLGGERRIVTLRRVTALLVDDLREGNIVSSIRIVPAARAASEGQPRLAERLRIGEAKLCPPALLFWLESSFGAEVIAICDEVDVGEPGVTLAPMR